MGSQAIRNVSSVFQRLAEYNFAIVGDGDEHSTHLTELEVHSFVVKVELGGTHRVEWDIYVVAFETPFRNTR